MRISADLIAYVNRRHMPAAAHVAAARAEYRALGAVLDRIDRWTETHDDVPRADIELAELHTERLGRALMYAHREGE